MKRTILALLAASLPLVAAARADDAVETCLAEARERSKQNVADGMTEDAAREGLEIAAARCHQPALPDESARFIGVVNADRARFAHALLKSRMTIAQYLDAVDDRRRKLADHRDDRSYHRAVEHDEDRDLVPDDQDACRDTPFGRATDDRGCPTDSRRRPGDDARLKRLLAGATTLYNPSCKGADRPLMPIPLEWGRGAQTIHGTQGFNMAVTRVGGMPAGCELFYEIQFRFIEPTNPATPPSMHAGVVFSATEELLGGPNRAVFGLAVSVPLPSPGRTKVRDAFNTQYMKVTWRVRAVNGSGVASPWSPYVTQGPRSGGVQG
jgi:hypothetical protein